AAVGGERRVGLGRAVAGDQLEGRAAVHSPAQGVEQVEELRIHVPHLAAAPVAQHVDQQLHPFAVEAPVANVGRGDLLAGVERPEREAARGGKPLRGEGEAGKQGRGRQGGGAAERGGDEAAARKRAARGGCCER